ncbi:MAG TPA: hypothetical protein VFL83_11315 [Anaeromyxobacter sp.]|nr:hypothetical protein [Anaeromyxobacter sp.]
MTALGLASVLLLAAAPEPQPPAASPPPSAPAQLAATPAATSAPAPAAPGPAPGSAAGPPATAFFPAAPAEGPDVELHVPRAEVAKLSLDVENLHARLDVDTSVARLVTIRAGIVATVEKLKAELEGVSAETHLVVRLNRVSEVLQRALGAIDENPQLAGGPVAVPDGAPPAASIGADAAAEARPIPSKSSTQ